MTNSLLTLEHDGAVAWLMVNRAARHNTLTEEMWRTLPSLLADAAAAPDVRVVVVRGAVNAAFCAGADIDELSQMARSFDRVADYAETLHCATRRLADLNKPTIAMIRGHCIGGGCALALACDLRVADTSALFAVTPAKLGLVYALEDTRLLVDLSGPARAKELLFTGRTLEAAEARDYGLIDRLVAPDRLQLETGELAAQIGANAPQSLYAAKRFTARVVEGITTETNDARRAFIEALLSQDFAEGASAFRERRPPRFSGD